MFWWRRAQRKKDENHHMVEPHKIRCINLRKSSIATKLESRDHHIIKNKHIGRSYSEFRSNKASQ